MSWVRGSARCTPIEQTLRYPRTPGTPPLLTINGPDSLNPQPVHRENLFPKHYLGKVVSNETASKTNKTKIGSCDYQQYNDISVYYIYVGFK